MNRRRIATSATALILSFGVLAAGSASAAPYGGHAMRKYGPSAAQVAQSVQQAQWAEAVRALDSGAVVPTPVSPAQSAQDIQQAQWSEAVRALDSGAVVPTPVSPAQSAQDIQQAQWAEAVRELDSGSVTLPSGNVGAPAPAPEPLSAPGSGTDFDHWLTIGLLSGLLALALSMVTLLLRRRPRPQLSL